MANTKGTIQTINRLAKEGIISRYALGGAFGALFYLEPTNTEDIDVFIHLHPLPGSALVSIKPLFDRLEELGYKEWAEDKLVVEGWPVQFLPAAKPLEIDALNSAMEHILEPGLNTWVPTPEHLMALAIDLGRPKDKFRLEQFYRQKAYDPRLLKDIIEKHGLETKWRKILTLFENDPEGL
jgi:hypothetical protein